MRVDDLIRAIERYAARNSVTYRAESGKGSHRKIWLGGCRSVVPIHRGDLPIGTYKAILRQLGISESDLKD
ncbi:type II toxin-antitoxin system HicA family toxin [Acidiphilium sp.]|uniref:type II toxin-antitoxin system HicA family toxin n=1 Tax=Acidiphilium sp. TaxID=527 RepID=UPI003CFEAD8A